MIETIAGVVATVASVVGLIVSTKGASRTKKLLGQHHEDDAIVNVLAWGDEKLLHTQEPTPTVPAGKQ